jgi:two-component system chemotaxis sensor kinase CheA
MTALAWPDELVGRFRGVALDRLERIEARWGALLRGEGDRTLSAEVHHELHTLKGEARMLGFAGLSQLCHALEELIAAAAARGYMVPEDVDLVVTMAIRFMAVLLRRKDGAGLGGMDVDGFIHQIEEVLGDLRAEEATAPRTFEPRNSQRPPSGVELPDRLSQATRDRLAMAATRLYLEHVAAGAKRRRLREVWQSLCAELGAFQATPLAPRLAGHADAARALATDLGKQVDVALDLDEVRVRSEVAEALEVAVLHTVRNAVDHGLESADARRAVGKPVRGTVRVSGRLLDAAVEVRIEDDGRGVDLPAVRARAIALGLLSPEAALRARSEELGDLLFRGGLSTRTEVTDVSGRGIGLDAVRAAIGRVGGRIRLTTVPGQGTCVIVRVPQASRIVPVVRFAVAGADVPFVVAASYSVTVVPPPGDRPFLDPVDFFDIGVPDGVASGGVWLEVRREGFALTIRAAGLPAAVNAERICPTAEDCPLEVVRTDGVEALLLRPELLVL